MHSSLFNKLQIFGLSLGIKIPIVAPRACFKYPLANKYGNNDQNKTCYKDMCPLKCIWNEVPLCKSKNLKTTANR